MNSPSRLRAFLLSAPLLVLFLWMVRGLLVAVALGGLFAVLFYPVRQKLAEKLGKRRRWSTPLLVIGVTLLVLAPLGFVAFMGLRSIEDLLADGFADKVGDFAAQALDWARGLLEPIGVSVSRESVMRAIRGTQKETLGFIAKGASALVASAPALLVQGLLFYTALYFFLEDGAALLTWIAGAAPWPQAEVFELFASVRGAISGVILGSLLTGGVQATLTLGFLLVLKIPGAFLWAFVAFLLSFIPMLGTTPVTVGTAVYLLTAERYGAAIAMAVGAVIIGLSDNVVRPWAQSAQSRMHPLLTLMAIFGGLEVFGGVGVFLGPVVAAMAVWSLDRLRAKPVIATGDSAASAP